MSANTGSSRERCHWFNSGLRNYRNPASTAALTWIMGIASIHDLSSPTFQLINTHHLSTPIYQLINAQHLVYLLQHHLDAACVHTVVHCFTHGSSIGFCCPRISHISANLLSTYRCCLERSIEQNVTVDTWEALMPLKMYNYLA